VSYFNGPAVRHRFPIDSTWGFYELPKLLKFIPEDVGTWVGPTWFLNPVDTREFVTVLAEEWGLHERPPFRIASWTALLHTGQQLSGAGMIALPKGWKACIIKGKFA
jgi:hypothetical protein